MNKSSLGLIPQGLFRGLLGLILITVLAAILSAFAKTSSTEPSPSSTETFQSSQNDQTGDWKTYKSAQHGYSLKYPRDWLLKEFDLGGIQLWSWDPEKAPVGEQESIPLERLVVEIYVVNYDNKLSLEGWISQQMRDLDPQYKILSQSRIAAAGLDGLRHEWSFGARTGITVYLDQKDKFYFINVQPANSKLMSSFTLLLSSLKFGPD